jgi:hypothetical protein
VQDIYGSGRYVLVKLKEPDDVFNAKEVIIELKPHCEMKWVSRKISECGKEIFLKSVARRAKEFLLGKLVAEDHIGTFPKKVMWEGASLAWDTDYKVLATEPRGEVRITLKTMVICRLGET